MLMFCLKFLKLLHRHRHRHPSFSTASCVHIFFFLIWFHRNVCWFNSFTFDYLQRHKNFRFYAFKHKIVLKCLHTGMRAPVCRIQLLPIYWRDGSLWMNECVECGYAKDAELIVFLMFDSVVVGRNEIFILREWSHRFGGAPKLIRSASNFM